MEELRVYTLLNTGINRCLASTLLSSTPLSSTLLSSSLRIRCTLACNTKCTMRKYSPTLYLTAPIATCREETPTPAACV